MDTYSTPQLLQVAGLPLATWKAWMRRRILRVSSGDNPGTGNPRQHTPTDVLQAAVLVKLGSVGVKPSRAALFWPVVAAALHYPEALLLLAPRAEGSDTDFRIVLPGTGADINTAGAPAVFAGLNIGAIKRDVAAKLAALA